VTFAIYINREHLHSGNPNVWMFCSGGQKIELSDLRINVPTQTGDFDGRKAIIGEGLLRVVEYFGKRMGTVTG
jgi:hypothetical protein